MLALLAAFLIGLSGAHAQSNTEYSFRQQSVTDGQAFNHNGDPVPELSMDCLAANGYGQWTLTSLSGPGGGWGNGWYLLSNGLYAPSTHFDAGDIADHPGCIPPGVVQHGHFAPFGSPTPAETKVTANLDGAVNYVWPDPAMGTGGTTREDFVVQGFRAPDVDLSLSFLSNPTPPMNLIAGSPALTHSYPAILIGTPANDVTTTAPYQDEFDVCSDAAYLYIAWCSTKTNPLGQIYYEVLDINTMAPVAGPALVAVWMRPTVGCDSRNNRNGAAPKFELAFIAPVYQNGNYVYFGVPPHNGGNLTWETYSGGIFTPHPPLVAAFLDPTNPNNPPLGYGFVTHARALVSSVAATGAWHAACYAIVDHAGFALILYNADDPNIPTGLAAYVDGALLTPPSPLPAPPPATPPVAGWPVKDAPIVAMANPYDNQDVSTDNPPNWRGYDQFHCLYQLDLSQNLGQPANEMNPLLIVRNSDNGETNPLQPDPKAPVPAPDTRLVLNQVETTPPPPQPQLLPDPTTYCAAVNQMGIHVHWRTPDGWHFYARDTGRSFDEPIDENTLVTDQCTVSDGTAHGGTVGAVFTGNRWHDDEVIRMTVWTDPNYGPPSKDGTSGLFSPRVLGLHNEHVGQLIFSGDNVQLNVYNNEFSEQADLPVVLTVMPFFYFDFLGSGQEVYIGAGGTFDYYGLYATHDGNGAQTAIGTPFTDGTGDGAGAGTIDIEDSWGYPTNLKVHGGADFYTGADGKLVSNSGYINVLDEGTVYPVTTGAANPAATGHMTLSGKTTLNSSTYWANIPDGTSGVTMSIEHGYTLDPLIVNDYQFEETHCSFVNTPSTAASEIDLGTVTAGASSFASSNFEGGTASATRIAVWNPGSFSPLEIDSMTFINQGQLPNQYAYYYAVYLYNGGDQSANSNASIIIDNNEFKASNYNTINAEENFADIHVNGFNNTSDPNGTISIVDNIFDGENGPLVGSRCIQLDYSTVTIVGNSIDGTGRAQGISFFGYTTPYSYTLICNNHFSGANGSDDYGAIESQYYHGTIKLNTFDDGVHDDLESFNGDNPLVVFNSMHYTNGGIQVLGNSTINMTGVQGPDGYAAYNTLMGPSYYVGSIIKGPIILKDINSFVEMGAPAGTQWSSDYGWNNIIVAGVSTSWATHILGLASSPISVGSLDQNYWADEDPSGTITVLDPANGSGSCSPSCDWTSSQSGETDAYGVDYTATAGKSWGTAQSPNFDVACGVGYPGDIASKHKTMPAAVKTADSARPATYCDTLFALGFYQYASNYQWQQCYDTLTKFIELCANTPQSWRAFDEVAAAAGGLSYPNRSILYQFHNWLESVLYLNTTDPEYFCACAELLTPPHPEDTTSALIQLQTDRLLALNKWLLENTGCDTAMLRSDYNNARTHQFQTWYQDSMYGYHYALDTTLPPLDSIEPGLLALLEKHFLYANVNPEPSAPAILYGVSASPNPANAGTVISFGISKEAYVKIEVFDILGNRVSSAGFESLFEPGNKAVPISLVGLPSGTYFARIVTAYGEVQTVKLVKE